MSLKEGPRKLAAGLARAARRALCLRGDEGGAVLEFGVMVPPLILVLTGAASFAMAFYTLQQLQNAVAGAVQIAAAQQGVNTDPCNSVMTNVQAALPSITVSNLNYSLTVTSGSGSTETATTYSTSGGDNGGNTAFSCKAAGADGTAEMDADSPVVLTVTYSYKWMTIVPIKFFSPSTPLTETETALAD
jgi:Flp pilus assembly protein TadG